MLLADDHPLTRDGTRQAMAANGSIDIVGEAGDGEETLRLAQQLRPDLLLLDISMPRLSGVEVASELHALHSAIRVLILTGYDQNAAHHETLLRLGVRGFLSKRASPSEIVKAVCEVHAGRTYFRGPMADIARGSSSPIQLTQREIAVMHLVESGSTNRQIADQLCVSEPTVRFHMHNLFTKLGVKSRTQLVNVGRQLAVL